MNSISDGILSKKEKELHEALTKEIKIEDIIKFVESQITRIINTYEK